MAVSLYRPDDTGGAAPAARRVIQRMTSTHYPVPVPRNPICHTTNYLPKLVPLLQSQHIVVVKLLVILLVIVVVIMLPKRPPLHLYLCSTNNQLPVLFDCEVVAVKVSVSGRFTFNLLAGLSEEVL